jgi:hypothetical protein
MVAIVQNFSPVVAKRSDSPILTTNKRPRMARSERSVKFADNHHVLEISTRAGFSRQELNFLYLSKSEHKRIQLEIVDLIREYKLGQKSWGGKEVDHLRGLEPLTNHDDVGRLRRMKSAVSAVVERQLNGSIDEIWLSKVYRPYSRAAQSLAYRRAQMDSHAAFSDAPRMIIMSR